MTKAKDPVFFLGVLPQRNEVLEALVEAEKLLESVAFVRVEGDTKKPLRKLRSPIRKVKSGK